MSRLLSSTLRLTHSTALSTVACAGRPAIAATRPIAGAPSAAVLPRVHCREYNVNGNEVKVGSTIKWEGRSYLVTGTSVNMKGRAHTTYNLDIKDVVSGSKKEVKVRPSDKVEVVEMQTVRMNFLYRQGNTLFFMDPVSFEQIELDATLAPGHSASYLIENSSTALVRDGETFVQIKVPEKAICTVESTSAARAKVNDAGGKDAKLTNGLTVSVPNYIEPGQHIVINTANDLFVSKSDQPPTPEAEKVY